MQLPYLSVKTPHLHPLPFGKGRGEELRMPENVAVVRPSSSRAFECGSLYASRFVEGAPREMARDVTVKQPSYLRRSQS